MSKARSSLSLDLFDSQPAVVKLDEVVLCQCSYGMFNFLKLHKGRGNFSLVALDLDMTWAESRERLLNIPY